MPRESVANESSHTEETADPKKLRPRIAAWAAADGVQPVAKALGISRNALTSFLAGLCSKGTEAQVTLSGPKALERAGY